MTTPPKRIAWIDVARGIGIVLVVYGHVLRGLQAAHMLSTANPIWASDYTIYTFHMPLFFILAGMQVDRSLSKGRWPFLKSKLMTIAYPYLLWSWFQLSLKLLAPKGTMNTVHSPITLLTILWAPVEQFWFLFVLFFCHLLAFVTGARRGLLTALMAAGVGGAVLIAQGRLSPYGLTGTLCPSLAFYLAGIFIGKRLMRWQPNRIVALAWATCSFVTLLALSHVCRGLSHGRPELIWSWPVTAAGVVLMVSLSHLVVEGSSAFADWFGILGRASMTIYIFHVLVAAAVRAALERAHVVAWAPQLIAGTIAGVVLPLALHMILERFDLLAALGLGAKRRTLQPQPAPLPMTPGLE
ncbi:MAG: acyltransferase [Edaphobacter sp.]|uniref:acyltransferase family protein n=1 Tax=Edaphobacter sp. TaxID=1934404 RepID=UPI0023A54D3F|nr:acyltransferase [Edaphobacter sp.]MDE1178841.1 acyltransferase [Edaphobacter sp.]